MRKNVNVVGDYTCDQFYQVKVYTERDEFNVEFNFSRISCANYL